MQCHTLSNQKVLTYVQGYIVFSLIRNYQKMLQNNTKINSVASSALQFLNNLEVQGLDSIDGESYLIYTYKWTDLVNRGS